MKSVRSSRLASLKMPFEASSSSHLHNLSSKAKNISSFCFRPKIQSVCQPTFSARNCSSRTQFRAIANNTTTKVTMFTSASRRVVSRVQRSAFSTAVKQPVVERRFAAPMVAAAAGLTAMAVASQQEVRRVIGVIRLWGLGLSGSALTSKIQIFSVLSSPLNFCSPSCTMISPSISIYRYRTRRLKTASSPTSLVSRMLKTSLANTGRVTF